MKTLTCCNFAQTIEDKEVHSPDCPYMTAVRGAEKLREAIRLVQWPKVKSALIAQGLTGSVTRRNDMLAILSNTERGK